jgi:hypothetical protein
MIPVGLQPSGDATAVERKGVSLGACHDEGDLSRPSILVALSMSIAGLISGTVARRSRDPSRVLSSACLRGKLVGSAMQRTGTSSNAR